MQKRHFIVREVDGTYQLKEIDSSIANAMSIFGIPKAEYQSLEVDNNFYYFCPVTSHSAREIAEQLSKQLLGGKP